MTPKRKHREVILAWASPLPQSLAAPTPPPGHTPEEDEPAPLPAGFPAHLLTEAQQLAISRWFSDWQENTLELIRSMLTLTPEEELKHFHQNATLLARLLRLHPACEHSVTQLATCMACDPADLNARNRELIRTAQNHFSAVAPSVHTPSIRELRRAYPQLDFARRVGELPVIIVPFLDPHATIADRMSTVLSLASHPGITAAETTMPSHKDPQQSNAIRITFPSNTHNIKRDKNMNTNRYKELLQEHLQPALKTAGALLPKYAMSLPFETVNALSAYIDDLTQYANLEQNSPKTSRQRHRAALTKLCTLMTTLNNHIGTSEPQLAIPARILRDALYA